MAAIYSNGGNRWNILGFNFTKRDALSSVYKISMVGLYNSITPSYFTCQGESAGAHWVNAQDITP